MIGDLTRTPPNLRWKGAGQKAVIILPCVVRIRQGSYQLFIFKQDKRLDKKPIQRNYAKWVANSTTIINVKKENCRCKQNVGTETNIEKIRTFIDADKNKLVRKLVAEMHLKRESANYSLKKDLDLKSYISQCHQEVSIQTKQIKLSFC